MRKILFAKYSNERNSRFGIKTIIVENNGKKMVEKYPLYKDSEKHVFSMLESYNKISELYDKTILSPAKIVKKKSFISLSFAEGENYESKLKKAEEDKDYNKFLELIKEFISIIKSAKGIKPFKKTKEYIEVFGNVPLPDNLTATDFCCFDMTFSNLIVNKGNIKIIDYEWCFDFPVPIEYIIFRSVILYLNFVCTNNKIRESVLLYLGYDEKIVTAFSKIENNFQNYVCKDSFSIGDLYNIMGRENYYIEPLLTQNINSDTAFFVQIFYDYGNNFSEENSIKTRYKYYEKINIKIPITADLKNVRIDPCNNSCIIILNRFTAISDSRGAFEINNYGINGLKTDNVVIFSDSDPQIVYTIEKDINYIELDFIVVPPNEEFIYHLLKIVNEKITYNELFNDKIAEINEITKNKDNEINEIIKAKDNEINNLKLDKNNEINEIIKVKDNEINEIIKAKDNEINEVIKAKDNEINTLNEVKNSEIKNLNFKLDNANDNINKLKEEISNEKYNIIELEKQLEQFKNENQNLNVKLNASTEANNAYINSSSWKITAPLRKVINNSRKTKLFLKTKFKNQLIKNNIAPSIVSGEQHSIDVLTFKDGVLKVRGWIFVHNKEINALRLSIKLLSRIYYIEEGLTHLLREDVFNIFKAEGAKNSGFEFNCFVHTSEHFEVFLEYKTENNFDSLPLGEFDGIASDNEEKISAITDSSMPIDIEKLIDKYINNTKLDFSTVYQKEYDIIIPIYNGYKYFKRLFSTLEKTKANYRLILINDCSPDKNVSSFLKEYSSKHKNVVIIEHKENTGFVKSVNDGLSKAKNDVVILNTDVELPKMWLERLMFPIVTDDKVATSTPFTNSGTICSFPNFLEDNTLFANSDVYSIDKAFLKIKPEYISAPTGVGFCMGMSKAAIDIVGFLDYETFSKGYGEENDWCQRAIKAGFKNVIVNNLFVFHNHGGSFSSAQKQALLKRNGELLTEKHPNYNKDVALYCAENPHKDMRNLLIYMLSCTLCNKSYIIFNHALGGGATKYLENFCIEALNKNNAVTVVEYDMNRNIYKLNFAYNEFKQVYCCHNFEYIFTICKYIKFDEIIINELVTYPKLYNTLEKLIELKNISRARLVHLLHDYFPICPSVNLLNKDNKHCYVNCSLEECNKCLSSKNGLSYNEYGSMAVWRENWGNFFEQCDDVKVFSQSSKELLLKTFNKKIKITVNPHKVNYMPYLNKKFKTSKSTNIGLLGILCMHKGIEIVKDLLKKINNNNLNIKIILIGSCDETIKDNNFIETGAYTYDELPMLSLKYDIDMFLIPSIWPETFSYTAEEAMKMGFDVASFDLGAPAERIKKYPKGHIAKNMNSDSVLEIIKGLKLNPIKDDNKILFLTDYFSFSSRYRVEHFIQQLLLNGITSDFISTEDINNLDLNKYTAIVFYRSKHTKDIETFIEKAHKHNISVYYDVDDLVFNYQKISYLDFLKGDDYSDFESYTKLINKCMQLCDGFITSTNHLKKEIENYFSGKPVCVNRNVASLEMLTISNKAKENTFKNTDKVILGYFSGSKTHDNDFAIINDTIIKIMEENTNVYLEIGGLLELSGEFSKFANRIIRFDFCDWKELPKLIASVDINLMPIEDTIFHKCKSENKWTEAALVNVCTVASYNDEIDIIIKDGINGYLCKTPEQWYNVLTELIKNTKLRKEISKNANVDVIKHSTVLSAKTDAIDFITKK